MAEPRKMDLSTVLSRVRRMVQMAEAPIHTKDPAERVAQEKEQKVAREMADALMLEYSIQEAMLEMERPAAQRTKPVCGEFATAKDNATAEIVSGIMSVIARHARCMIRRYTRYDREEGWMCMVYGFEHDLRYFEVMYTTIRLHMLGALRPKIDPSLSLDQNCYNLFAAGYNWLEMATMYGWRRAGSSDVNAYIYADKDERQVEQRRSFVYELKRPWINPGTGEIRDDMPLAGVFKRAYRKECARRDEPFKSSSAGASKTYRTSAMKGYSSRIAQRIRETERARTGIGKSVELRREDLIEFFREQNASMYTRCPKCGKLSDNPFSCDRCRHQIAVPPEAVECERCKKAASGYCRDHKPLKYYPPAHSEQGWAAGVAHANTADLGGKNLGHVSTAIEG
jgi:hypothetical protein